MELTAGFIRRQAIAPPSTRGTVLEQLGEHGGDVEPFPDPAEQQRSTDALGRDRQRSVGVRVERVDEQHLISELGAGRKRAQAA